MDVLVVATLYAVWVYCEVWLISPSRVPTLQGNGRGIESTGGTEDRPDKPRLLDDVGKGEEHGRNVPGGKRRARSNSRRNRNKHNKGRTIRRCKVGKN